MSMDDVHARAQALARQLEKFNDNLRRAMTEVDQSHRQVSPMWKDAMRRDYDRTWLPLEEKMKEYNQRVGPRYLEFMLQRLRHLTAYLNGHGN